MSGILHSHIIYSGERDGSKEDKEREWAQDFGLVLDLRCLLTSLLVLDAGAGGEGSRGVYTLCFLPGRGMSRVLSPLAFVSRTLYIF